MQNVNAVPAATSPKDDATYIGLSVGCVIAFGALIYAPHSPVKNMLAPRWEPLTATQEYEASVWCEWRNGEGAAETYRTCRDELADPYRSARKIQKPGVLSEIVAANSAWASAEPERKAEYWAGRANSLAVDARRAAAKAAEAHAKVDVAMSYTDAHGCEHRVGSDGRERDQFRAFVICSKRRLGLS